jgi:O-antigen/teichoic acid export membrane protein
MRVPAIFERPRTLFRAYLTSAGKQAARNLVALVALTGLTQVAALGTVLLLTNGLGPNGFGVFTFALTLQPYLYLLGTLGTPLVLFREGTKEPEQLDQIATVQQAVALAGSLVVGGLTAGVACLAPISGVERGLIGLIAAGNVAAGLALAPVFDVQHRQPLVAGIGLATEVGTFLAVLTLVETGTLGLVSLGAVFALKWWFTAAAQHVVYRCAIGPLRPAFSSERLRRMLRSSVPVAFSTLIAGVPANAGVFFVRFLRGDSEAGIFGIASQAALAYLLFSSLAIRILQPHIAGPYGMDRFFLLKLILFAAVFLTLLYLGGLAAGTGAVLLILAAPYRAAVAPMAVLLAAALLFSAGSIASSYLIVLHREKTVLAAHAAAAVVYVVGAIVLVPLFATVGAAAAAALAAASGTLWMVVAVGTNLPPPADLGKVE